MAARERLAPGGATAGDAFSWAALVKVIKVAGSNRAIARITMIFIILRCTSRSEQHLIINVKIDLKSPPNSIYIRLMSV